MSKSAIAPAILVLALAATLGGCVTKSKSAVIAPLAATWVENGRVDEIVFDGGGIEGVSPAFAQTFQTNVKAKLDACAKGGRPLKLEASIRRLDKANKAMVIVLGGGKSAVRGHAKLIDPATGATVGEYDIGQNVVGARPAMLVMLNAEQTLSKAFGDELCARAFKPAA